MRILAIDLGEKRIGLAICDPEERLAVPLGTVARSGRLKLVHELARIARLEGVERLLVGEPLRLDGSAGEAAGRARRLGLELAAACQLPVEFLDEALTSHEARTRLRQTPGRGEIDAVAAQVLLEDYLGRRRP
jgi:putative Holliday junction resolvase